MTNMITGLREDFFTGISKPPVASLESPNNLSVKAQPKMVSRLIMKEVKRGFLVGPFRTPPFSLYRVSPLLLAEGTYSGKMRLIVDLSDPHNSDKHTSLNELINKQEYSVLC